MARLDSRTDVEFISNAAELAAGMKAASVAIPARIAGVVAHHGLLLQANVKRRAAEPRYAERPKPEGSDEGPRIITGDYNRSIYLRITPTSAEVGTNKPQGRRLEFGFSGTDSLGRTYDQPPYAHFGPGFDDTVPGYMAALSAVISDTFGGGAGRGEGPDR